MKTGRTTSLIGAAALGGFAVALVGAPTTQAQIPGSVAFVSESALLDGLASGAAFPFIDSTPRGIARAHVAITDATAACAPGAAPPANMQVLAGEAGVALVPVMTAETNTGISTTPGQCVFHATITPGQDGVPARVTDIVVLNTGPAPLTGINTVTVSAEVR
jgi:hypothetical protein